MVSEFTTSRLQPSGLRCLHVRHSLVSAYSVDGTRKAPAFLITDVLWPLTAEHPNLYAFFFFSLKQERVCQ